MIQIVPKPYSLPATEDLTRDAAPHPRWAMLLVNDPDIVFVDCTREPAVERRNVTASHTVAGRIENSEPWGQHLPLGSFEIRVPAITDALNEFVAPEDNQRRILGGIARASWPKTVETISSAETLTWVRGMAPSHWSDQHVNNDSIDMSTEIAAGDLVVLKSGGPTMTAGQIIPKGAAMSPSIAERNIHLVTDDSVEQFTRVECWWFPVKDFINPTPDVGGSESAPIWDSPRSEVFPADALKKV